MIAADSAVSAGPEDTTQIDEREISIFSGLYSKFCLLPLSHFKSGSCLVNTDHLSGTPRIVLVRLLVTILTRQVGAWESPSHVKVGRCFKVVLF